MVDKKRGVGKKRLFSFLILSLFICLAISTFIFATSGFPGLEITKTGGGLTATINSTEDSIFLYNFTINNSIGGESGGEKYNISEVNISLPSEFVLTLTSSNLSNMVGSFDNFSDNVLRWRNSSGPLGFLVNGSNTSAWLAFNASVATPGQYTINFTILWGENATRNQTTHQINVTVNDTTSPSISSTNFVPTTQQNYSGTFIINGTITDNYKTGLGVNFVNISIYNSSGSLNATYIAKNLSSDYWNISILTTQFPDGIYNITIYTNDTSNNINSTNITNIRFDNTVPTISFSCTPTNLYVGDTLTCSCSSTDSTSGINTTTYTANPSTTDTGTYTQICTSYDNAGNSKSVTSTYIIELQGSASPSGGSPSSTTVKPVTKITSFSEITPTTPQTMTGFSSSSGVNQIQIEVSQTATNVKVTVNDYSSAPSTVSAKTGTYKYLQVQTENLADKLSKASMKIQVGKSWVSAQGLTKEDITLYKYDESSKQWKDLVTTYSSEDDKSYYYIVDLTSFSYFSIAPKPVVSEEGETMPETTPGESILSESQTSVWTWIIISLLILGIIAGIIYYLMNQKKKK